MHMKYKDLFLAASVIVALAACSDNFADAPPVVTPPAPEPETQEVPILFSSNSSETTRAEYTGADAANLLGSQFIVSGYKGETTDNMGGIVFDNYSVIYHPGTANTTESNTSNWEYVGEQRIKHAIDNGVTRQSVKYWDYTKAQYDFIAWSAGKDVEPIYVDPAPDPIPAGQVYVSAITPETATGEDGVAYTFKGAANDLTTCYIADLVTVKKASYGVPVTIKFRSLGAKVRIALYETVPGYSVKDVKFYSGPAVALADETDPSLSDAQRTANARENVTPKLFSTTDNQIYTAGTYTVYYPHVNNTANTDNNLAHVRFSGTTGNSKIVNFSMLNYTIAEDGEKKGTEFLGRTSATASMAGEAEGNYYSPYLPNETGVNLNLRVNYTLESIDGTGEEIFVKGATAQVPSIYTKWKPGYAYTYLFKISDKTNGHTGFYDPEHPDDITINSDPAGLYPISFDAVVVNDVEDATQETVTLVSTPSITTYQKGSKVVDNDEYRAADGDIYVTVNDGAPSAEATALANGRLQTLTADNAALYMLPNIRRYTEAEVVDAMQMREEFTSGDEAILGRNGLQLFTTSITPVSTIEKGPDGNPIVLEGNQAAKFTPVAGTYAFVYTKTQPSETPGDWKFSPVNLPLGQRGLTHYWRYDYKRAPAGDLQKGYVYYDKDHGYKENVFLGQTVNNLYLRENVGTAEAPVYQYTIASGYAVTGTDYYYTTDNGRSYKQAANIPYANFAGATDIYTLNGVTYTLKTDTEPQDGTAYYLYNDADGSYTYCVILPEQAYDKLRILAVNDPLVRCTASDQVLKGQTYFDRYFKNDGVYYVKVIKVQ